MTSQPKPVTLESFTRRTVRSWWTDGLWDFAVAGFLALMGVWLYVLLRVTQFPTWSWPWPFITQEIVNPMEAQLMLWAIGFVPLSMFYLWLAYRVVNSLKARWLASRQGYVQHSFWLKVEPRFYYLYIGSILALIVGLVLLALWRTGSPRWYSMLFIAVLSSVSLALGITYAIRRYLISSGVGLFLCVVIELFFTTPADYMQGPRRFLDVLPNTGNPAVPLLVWAGLFVLTGLYGLINVLRKEPYESE